jgi:hypothetical protein
MSFSLFQEFPQGQSIKLFISGDIFFFKKKNKNNKKEKN